MAVVGIVQCQKLEDYRQSVLHAGGEVQILSSTSIPAAVCEQVDAILLTSGGDITATRYGASPRGTDFGVDLGRDEFELELVLETRRRGLPLLAVCRGIQVLNVAMGGTLIQDIPSQVPGAVEHRLSVPPHQPYSLAHEIWIEDGTLLRRVLSKRLLGTDSCQVNSRHHQAVEKLGDGLQAVATAPDGIVEAIEDPDSSFVLGVQWHAENFWRTGEFSAMFEAFVQAAGGR